MMTLFYTQNSPYARIIRIAVREFALDREVEERLAKPRQPDNPVLEVSPVGRVPALVAEGLTITETVPVFRRIAAAAGRAEGAPDWPAISLEGQVLGFLEGLVAWARELRRDPQAQSEFLIKVEAERAPRCLSLLETVAAAGALPDMPSFSAIALATALSYMEFRSLIPDWRDSSPKLAAWLARQEERGSMMETAPVPD